MRERVRVGVGVGGGGLGEGEEGSHETVATTRAGDRYGEGAEAGGVRMGWGGKRRVLEGMGGGGKPRGQIGNEVSKSGEAACRIDVIFFF